MNSEQFQAQIGQGIPAQLPPKPNFKIKRNAAPKRTLSLTPQQTQQAIQNALRYFPNAWHSELAEDFLSELQSRGRIYMYRFQPKYQMFARPLREYPHRSTQAAAIMMMIQNNLDPEVAQYPDELITYGGNGAVFQNWAQYLIAMRYLSQITNRQTLHLYSGHPMGIFPSSQKAPRVVITNGMMIPNYSQKSDWNLYNALGVTQYGQMTAGSFMYIGPQGIVHGTTLTLANAFRKLQGTSTDPKGLIFVSSGLGGMSGAQAKAAKIVGCIGIIAEIDPEVAQKRYSQGWVDELITDADELVSKIQKARTLQQGVSFGFIGNIVDLWELLYRHKIPVAIGSDQTSLHNPFDGGYHPVGLSLEASTRMCSESPKQFKQAVQHSLRQQFSWIQKHQALGMYFFDYGNAFLLEAQRAGAAVNNPSGDGFIFPSYVEDIMGPMCFDFGFGPFRWICSSGLETDLNLTDQLAIDVLTQMLEKAPAPIKNQLADNLKWIQEANDHQLVVGSQARILYADAPTRIALAEIFHNALAKGKLKGAVILGRDHHDVGGTDSPYRETSNIKDGSKFTADMAVHNVIGDSFRGASWVSLHNGGGVGWGEALNGGFGLVLDGSLKSLQKAIRMLYFDVNNGVSRRAWAGNPAALWAIKRAMKANPDLVVTLPNTVDDDSLDPKINPHEDL